MMLTGEPVAMTRDGHKPASAKIPMLGAATSVAQRPGRRELVDAARQPARSRVDGDLT